jgi:hypothetical protein
MKSNYSETSRHSQRPQNSISGYESSPLRKNVLFLSFILRKFKIFLTYTTSDFSNIFYIQYLGATWLSTSSD